MDFDISKDDLYCEHLPNVCVSIKNKAKTCCTPVTLRNLLPILGWLPQYKARFLLPDFVAGLTVGLTAIPQAIAYATVAGLPPQYGLYSAFVGCFVYILFGTCKDITVGPTAIMALMVQTHVKSSPEYAVLSCFLSGCVILLLGFLKLGVLVRFISIPVTTGFTMAAAITIASGQINNLFGIKSSSNEFIASWQTFFTQITETRRNDASLGISTLIALLLMRKIKDLSCGHKTWNKYISLSRNALAVIIGILLSRFLSSDGWTPFRVSGEITPGIPPFRPPPFSTTTINGTVLNFGNMASNLGTSLISIPLISILESVAIAKAFSKGKIVDASQEMVALGISNIVSSFFSSMPITGSFTRTAINNSSGVKTTLGGAVTGTLVLMTLAYLTTTFYYIPKATLAAIIIAAMIFMVEYNRIREIWSAKKLDLFPFLVTVLVCLFWSLEYGMVFGIVANMLFILYKSAKPIVLISRKEVSGIVIGVVDIQESIGYSSAEYLKSLIITFIVTHNDIAKIVIKGEEVRSIDFTVALNLVSLKQDLSMLNCELLFWNWNISTASVICRLDRRSRSIFKFGKTLSEIIQQDEMCQIVTNTNI